MNKHTGMGQSKKKFKYNWLVPREVKIEHIKSKKLKNVKKIRTWTKRKDRKHL